jgi:molybdopterin-guanine dinucleotide biosynthesis protein A
MERSVAVQAGGRSSRMGRDKALVRLAGRSLIEHVLDHVEGLAQEVLVTSNRPETLQFLRLPIFQDVAPAPGALEGLKTALFAAHGRRVLVVGCDMPFLSRPLLEHLFESSEQAEVTVPRWNDRLQPLCAVYSPDCLAAIEVCLAAGDKRMISFHDQIKVAVIDPEVVAGFDPDGMSFFNVNTPQDLEKAEQIHAAL